jgi:hypothetical protein
VVLPWSTWAMMAIFRRSFRSICICNSQLSVSSYRRFAFSGWLLINDHGRLTMDHIPLPSSTVDGLLSIKHTKTPDGEAEGFIPFRSACGWYFIRVLGSSEV